MNADAQQHLSQALERGLREAGIVIERGVFVRGNLRGYESIDLAAVARRTVGIWCSWGWVVSLASAADPAPAEAPAASHLRLMESAPGPIDSYLDTDGVRQLPERQNNDNEDDGA